MTEEERSQEVNEMSQTARVFARRDGGATMDHCIELALRGAIGSVAVAMYQAQYTSSRAKSYRRRGRNESYDRKNVTLVRAPGILEAGQIVYGWKTDPNQEYHNQVLYVDLPTGQVSFHSATRGYGPDYQGDWDGLQESQSRIFEFCDQVLDMPANSITHMPYGKHVLLPLSDIDDGYKKWLKAEQRTRFERIFGETDE